MAHHDCHSQPVRKKLCIKDGKQLKQTAQTPLKWQENDKLTQKFIFGLHKKYTHELGKP